MKKTTLFLLVAGIFSTTFQPAHGMFLMGALDREESRPVIEEMKRDFPNEWLSRLLELAKDRKKIEQIVDKELEQLASISNPDICEIVANRISQDNYKPLVYLDEMFEEGEAEGLGENALVFELNSYNIQTLENNIEEAKIYHRCKTEFKEIFESDIQKPLLAFEGEDTIEDIIDWLLMKFQLKKTFAMAALQNTRRQRRSVDFGQALLAREVRRKKNKLRQERVTCHTLVNEITHRIVAGEIYLLHKIRSKARVEKARRSNPAAEDPLCSKGLYKYKKKQSPWFTPKCCGYCLLGTAGIIYGFKRQAPEQFQVLVDYISDQLSPITKPLWNLCKKLCPGEDRREHED